MARKPERYPALYERLSHDDELQGESNSISNQKRILEDLRPKQLRFYQLHPTLRDDGISRYAICVGLDSDYFLHSYHVAAVMVDNLRRLLLGINLSEQSYKWISIFRVLGFPV